MPNHRFYEVLKGAMRYQDVKRGIKGYKNASCVSRDNKRIKDIKSIIDCINGINNIIRLVRDMLSTY